MMKFKPNVDVWRKQLRHNDFIRSHLTLLILSDCNVNVITLLSSHVCGDLTRGLYIYCLANQVIYNSDIK